MSAPEISRTATHGANAPDESDRAPGAAPIGRRHSRRGRSRALTLLVLVAPSVLLLAVINGYPVVYGLVQSTHDSTLISSGAWTGLANYTHVFTDPSFWSATLFTLIFTVVGVFGSWAVGLGLALLLRTSVPGATAFKVLLMLPWVVPVVVSTTAWNWLIATSESPIPKLIHALGFADPMFLSDPTTAKVTVCLFKVWASFPFMMVMMSSALAAVDHALYEASSLDGAGRWQQLTRITLPNIGRSTYISWILMMIFCVNDFPSIYLLTGGGPANSTTTLIVLAYRTVFQNFQVGTGVAIAFVLTAALVLVSVVLYRQIRKVETA
ncbi:carbohydrate ABC transporter permease [Rugosimonospora africana]|uniref:Transporter n=1 Tax=Rugosimonospora africana TaxID=556532 RepID=A0A8J3QWV5_9ACTN|nr:sugar ABC transporter permease [Rugosimonospora africana]GIH17240.1 transporter [Rugosimonospora africana]